jgi:hypothetical protein
MEFEDKVEWLNGMGTAKLLRDIQFAEDTLEGLLIKDANYRRDNVGYLASYGDDCGVVKARLAELALEPPVSAEGKKLTAPQTEAWLRQQRTANEHLASAIALQNDHTFQIETNRINIDMAKKRLESLRGVMAMRTAQIEFLK